MNPISVSQEYEHQRKMLLELGRLYQSIETQKAQMLARLESVTSEEQHRSTPSEWSPLQVMDHVVIVEEWMAGPNATALPANAKVLLKGYLFLAFGGGVMRYGVRVPTLPAARPQEKNLDYSVIKQRWDAVRESLTPKLWAVTQETQYRPIALHPVAGPLNAEQVLRLLNVHLAYHLRYFPH